MKLTRRITTLLLALVMVLSMSATVFAEDATTYTITITGTSEGHTYQAYQIFTGDMDDEGKLSNIVWGTGVTADGQTALGTPADIAENLTSVAAAEAFSADVADYLTAPTATATVAEGASSCALTGLPTGYYLIKTSAVPETNGVYTQYIMYVMYVNADTTVTVKASVPPFNKDLMTDDNVVSIGDTVEFVLSTTMPSDLAAYETYALTFYDQLPTESLEFMSITGVLIYDASADAEITLTDADYNTTGSDTANGKLVVSIPDILALGAESGDDVGVIYTAKVKTTATIGDDGFKNTAYLKYSNDPYSNSMGTTPVAEVTLFTWQIPVFKYTGSAIEFPRPEAPVSEGDSTETPIGLAGAGFTLYADEACTQPITVTKDTTVTDANLYRLDENGEEEIVTDATGRFTIGGLGNGTYYLKETTTPSGYNTADVVAVTIAESGTITMPNPNGGPNVTVTEVSIYNQAGSTLPSTGGMGTTLFYIIGGILVLAAVVLLVTKRRMSAAE